MRGRGSFLVISRICKPYNGSSDGSSVLQSKIKINNYEYLGKK